MREYLKRWAVAVGVVAPIMFLVVPVFHRLLFAPEGPHANDNLWQSFLSMAGFYGGYVLLAGTVASFFHTWLVNRSPALGTSAQVVAALVVGAISFLPQAAVFGRGYWVINIVAGSVAGALYGLLVTLRPGLTQSIKKFAVRS